MSGKMNPAFAYKKIESIYNSRKNPRQRGSQGPMLNTIDGTEDAKRKAKSVERQKVYHQFSGMTQNENQAFDELFK